MRSVILCVSGFGHCIVALFSRPDTRSSNYTAKDTRRLGATIDVEQSAVRLLGSLVLVCMTRRDCQRIQRTPRTLG
jgi:hypothetical protein